MFIRDKPTFSSERMSHKYYDSKDSAENEKSVFVGLEGLDQIEMIGGKPPLVK
jgi:hypothetical protein